MERMDIRGFTELDGMKTGRNARAQHSAGTWGGGGEVKIKREGERRDQPLDDCFPWWMRWEGCRPMPVAVAGQQLIELGGDAGEHAPWEGRQMATKQPVVDK